MLITLAGVIGSGKSSLTKILSEELNTKPFYEPVDDNPVLPLFYKGNELVAEGKAKTNPYAYLLQTFFLNQRFAMIKQAMQEDNNILDRSIYEDEIFMRMNTDMGNATDVEFKVYQDLLSNMLEELPYAAHKKTPDLMIVIKVSYETMIEQIKKRGRSFEQIEQDPSLVDYYKTLLKYYKEWINSYDISPMIIIDGDKYDFVENMNDRAEVLDQIEKELLRLGKISKEKYLKLKERNEKLKSSIA